jgi:protein-S-isoprenylcysteine O-methyltransferase Ste14
MRRTAFLVYGSLCHALFLAVFAWMALFIGDIWLAETIDKPAAPFSWHAFAIDLGLVALFCAPHSRMARPGFKRRWTRLVPEEIERSTYVLVSSALMIVLLLAWRPFGPVIWHVDAPAGRALLWGLFGAGWLMVPLVSFLIDHFDLFGTRQVWLAYRERPYTHHPLGVPGLYRFVRHPLYIGWMLAFWATPTMTAGHLLFAIATTLYMLIAIPIEERDLIAAHGEAYVRYRREVPALLPWWIPLPGRAKRGS